MLTVTLANFLHFNRHFRVAVRWHLGEQVVFNLVAQVARHDVEQLATSQIG